MLPLNQIVLGDCEQVLKSFPDNSIDLIITSPPYADSRKKTYGGIHPDDYVAWFLPKTHSATFPFGLPEWFIKLFTQGNDIVLDPFVGSGTTAIVAHQLARHYIGIELNERYHQLASDELEARKKQKRL